MTKDIESVSCTIAVHPGTWQTVVDGAKCYRMDAEDFLVLAGYLFAKSLLAERQITPPAAVNPQCEGSEHDEIKQR